MTEQEYKKYIYEKAEKVKTKKQLDALLKEVVNNKDLDYGQIVYAMSACMKATANYIDRQPVGGITGFQASFIGWEMVKEFIHKSEVGMKLMDYEDMLYPQYKPHFEKVISKKTWDKLQQLAKEKLEKVAACPKVKKHWKSIAAGKVPFGFKVKE